jgi:hypothetical protein
LCWFKRSFKKAKKKPPEWATKGKFGKNFSECVDYPQRYSRAVKSTLTMLVIGDNTPCNEAGAIRLGHLPHRIGAVCALD